MKPNGKDRGYCYDRTKHNPLEKALADQWEHENIAGTNINAGHGILQDLFVDTNDRMIKIGARFCPVVHELTDRERFVVATVIQWLGSNCGQSFLHEAFRKCGLKITRTSEIEKGEQ